jgi:hypothetical protein
MVSASAFQVDDPSSSLGTYTNVPFQIINGLTELS